MKIQSADCLAILRSFGVAEESNIPRDISRIRVSNPSPANTAAEFRYDSKNYALLFDEMIDDNKSEILDELTVFLPGRALDLLQNPVSITHTYGLPYKGKTVYLAAISAQSVRLDIHLSKTYPDLSRSSWQKRIKAGDVEVNGEVQDSPKSMVADEDEISIKELATVKTNSIDLPIIYIDDNVVVIDKPEGMLTHSKNQLDTEFTVADFFKKYATEDMTECRYGVVHRLDRGTSGVIVGARNTESYDILKKQFADRQVEKVYVAIVDGTPKLKTATIDVPIARDSKNQGRYKAYKKGKPAKTTYRVESTDDSTSLLTLQPKTGRTHQIRVHMAHIGCPVHGDSLYGKPADRLYLHAKQLTIRLPEEDMPRTFTSTLPESFKKYVSNQNE